MPAAPDHNEAPPDHDQAPTPAVKRERQRPKMSRRSAVVTAVGGVAVALLLFLVMVNVARTSGGSGGGDDGDGTKREFVVGRAGSLAGSVARHGPLLIQDPLRGRQNIYVQHLGEDRWRAFDSHAPGAPLTCQLKWRPSTRDLHDACSDRVYPADGTGLVSYPTRVNDDDRVLVDLRSPTPPPEPITTTTAPPTTAPVTATSAPG